MVLEGPRRGGQEFCAREPRSIEGHRRIPEFARRPAVHPARAQGEQADEKEDFLGGASAFLEAAKLGHPYAQWRLAAHLWSGMGMETNLAQSMAWLRKAEATGGDVFTAEYRTWANAEAAIFTIAGQPGLIDWTDGYEVKSLIAWDYRAQGATGWNVHLDEYSGDIDVTYTTTSLGWIGEGLPLLEYDGNPNHWAASPVELHYAVARDTNEAPHEGWYVFSYHVNPDFPYSRAGAEQEHGHSR